MKQNEWSWLKKKIEQGGIFDKQSEINFSKFQSAGLQFRMREKSNFPLFRPDEKFKRPEFIPKAWVYFKGLNFFSNSLNFYSKGMPNALNENLVQNSGRKKIFRPKRFTGEIEWKIKRSIQNEDERGQEERGETEGGMRGTRGKKFSGLLAPPRAPHSSLPRPLSLTYDTLVFLHPLLPWSR